MQNLIYHNIIVRDPGMVAKNRTKKGYFHEMYI